MGKDQGGYYLTPKRVFHEGQGHDVHMAAESWANSINLGVYGGMNENFVLVAGRSRWQADGV